ncbi:hypothetical protein FRC00_012685 [Tulasnella sp. 408]|nr:hypothetical protein FRC00_012685 [Tulasnella sp. 408]
MQDIAVKKMRVADNTDFERVLGLTIRETEFLAKLNHKNIVELEGFIGDVSKGIIGLVFPWAWDGNLKDFIAREKWEIPERISLVSDVAKGLEYLHSRNPPICHGDLKSLNVLIYGQWETGAEHEKFYARIADFGSASHLPKRDPNTQIEEMVTASQSMQPPTAAFCASTKTITLTGNKYTLRWAAPELLLQEQFSLWSDIWALGWTAYEVMTGSLPFEDVASEVAAVECVVEGKLPSLMDNAHLSLMHEICSLSFEKLPMFPPEMVDDSRIISHENLTELGHMYQSRGQYGRAFAIFVDTLQKVRWSGSDDQILPIMLAFAQLARLREENSDTIAVFDSMCQILSRSNEEDIYHLPDAFCDIGALHQHEDEGKKTRKTHYEGRDLWEQERLAQAVLDMAQAYTGRRNLNKAISLYANALRFSINLGYREGGAQALCGLADVHRRRGEYDEAILLYSEVLKIRTGPCDGEGRAWALCGLADVHRHRSEYEEAISLYSEVLKIYPNFRDRESIAHALWGLADVHRRRSEYKKAISLYFEGFKIRTYSSDRESRTDALWGLADVHRRQRRYNKAIPLYSQVLRIRNALGDREGKAQALWGLADVHRRRREYEEAIPLYSEVLEIRTDLGNQRGRANALRNLAEMHRLRGDFTEAIPLHSEALKILTELGDEKGRAAVLAVLGPLNDLHQPRSEHDKAIPLCQKPENEVECKETDHSRTTVLDSKQTKELERDSRPEKTIAVQ